MRTALSRASDGCAELGSFANHASLCIFTLERIKMTYERVVIECEDGGGVFDEDHANERGGHGAFAPERKFDADGSLTRLRSQGLGSTTR